MSFMNFITTCAGGLETLIAMEVQGWSGVVEETGAGSVRWSGPLASGYRACLWSRFGSRVLLVINEFDLGSVQDVYDQATLIPWEEHLAEGGCFAVDCHLGNDAVLTHNRFAALRLKDAIVDRFRDRTGQRPDVQLKRPDVRFHLSVRGNRGTVAVDLSGESLHRRGYRHHGGEAPLKESLAAAIIKLSGWDPATPLIDPLCGSGTLLIEAALMRGDVAPGLERTYFGFQKWMGHQERLWQELVEEALAREEQGQRDTWPPLLGYDADPEMVAAARRNVGRAGCDQQIAITCRELSRLHGETGSVGWVVCNPPYGERLSSTEAVRYLYRCLGNRLRESFSGWHLALFTGRPEYADLLQFSWRETWRLYNGPLPCGLYVADISAPDPAFCWQVGAVDEAEGRDLVNRLKKNLEKRLPWSRQEGIECFRIYDRDLPDYNVVIEIFRKWVFIKEFSSGKAVCEQVAEQRWKTVVGTVRSLLGVGRDRLFFARYRRDGKSQRGKGGKKVEVGEGMARYLVEFTPGAVSGFDLDQRSVRRFIHDHAAGKAFLSLADRDGAAAVQAALGGADKTVTLAVSPEAAGRMAENYALNGLYAKNHHIVVADVHRWLAQEDGQYDLILLTIRPGFQEGGEKRRTFSPEWCGELIDSVMRRLRPQGTLLCAVHERSFTLAQPVSERYWCRQCDRLLLPRDAERRAGRSRFWEVRHKR